MKNKKNPANAWIGCWSQKLKYKAQTRTCTNRMLAYYNIGHFYPNESIPGVDFVFVYLFWIINTKIDVKFITNKLHGVIPNFSQSHKKKIWEKNRFSLFLKLPSKLNKRNKAVLASVFYIKSKRNKSLVYILFLFESFDISQFIIKFPFN